MDVSDIHSDDTPKSFYNPCTKPVKVDYYDEKNLKETVIIPPLQMATYPAYKTDVLVKYVLDAYIEELGIGYATPEKRQELLKIIYR